MEALRYLYRTVLGLFAGAQLAFTALFAPQLFRQLGPVLAAKVVRMCLPVLDMSAVLLSVLAIAAVLAHDGAPRRREWIRMGCLIAIIALALASLLWLTPEMMHLRLLASDDISGLASDDPLRMRFGALHGVSASMTLVELSCALVALGFPLLPRPPSTVLRTG